MSATNILYLTSRCNFDCEYCYEHRDKENMRIFDLSEEEARKSIDEIMARESDPNKQTMIVLFGGEPTLNWDVCKDAILYAYSLKQNVFFCLSTNGWKFRHDDFCRDFARLACNVNYQIGLDLSFDGVGNHRRVLLGGHSTTDGMYRVLKNVHRYNIRYNLRYTVHAGNHEMAADDVATMDKFFKPEKFVLSYDTGDIGIDTVNNVKTKLREYFRNGIIRRPICNDVCDICRKCDINRPISYWAGNNIRNLACGENATDFKDFNDE